MPSNSNNTFTDFFFGNPSGKSTRKSRKPRSGSSTPKTTKSKKDSSGSSSSSSGGIKYGDYLYKSIKKSQSPTKKYDAIFEHAKTGKVKTVSFGSVNEKDYTQLKDRKYRDYYLSQNKLKDKNLMSPQALNHYILWNKSDIGSSIESYKRMLKREQK